MSKVRLIDNKRVKLTDYLKDNLLNYKDISIASGYWDIEGMSEFIDYFDEYESIRLVIGQEPLIQSKYMKIMEEEFNLYSNDFPGTEIKQDLVELSRDNPEDKLRYTAKKITELINKGILEVKILRKPRLHAKAYILGNETSNNAVGIIGSSNFTKAGLNSNLELNYLEDQVPLVVYKPLNDTLPHSHLSWFNELWNDQDLEDWTFEFKELVEDSPLGDLTFGAYDVYIKTLMEVFSDELIPPQELTDEMQDILYAFQNRNAGILINKLNKMGIAILSDSVGLGKTITGGAVIKHYLKSGKTNIQVIAPASLKQQWIDDLSSVLGLEERDGDFNIVSQQDSNAIEKIYEYYDKSWRQSKNIDLFVIDESHNLRSGKGRNYETILKLLKQHPESHVLLLTATPINNTLIDIANQIQLGSKGNLTSVNVPYKRPGSNDVDVIDFFDALNRIQSLMKKATKEQRQFDFAEVKATIHDGLRHYLVRSTRQGVEAEGSLIDKDGNQRRFPTSIVNSIDYDYKKENIKFVNLLIESNISNIFDDINPLYLNIDILSQVTQQTSHPIDFIKEIIEYPEILKTRYNIELSEDEKFYNNVYGLNLIESILKVIFTLGFTPYRPEVYRHKLYNKSLDEIRTINKTPQEGIQLTIHNILQVTWLKRLESSMYAFYKSIKNYKSRLELFDKYLKLGFIINLSDLELIENEYDQGDDIENAFKDYEEYLVEYEEALKTGNEEEIKKKGVKRNVANAKYYNIDQLSLDIKREFKLVDFLVSLIEELLHKQEDTKMIALKNKIQDVLTDGKYGQKILVFSFFADTIEYLSNELPKMVEPIIPNFEEKSEFISGRNREVESIVKRFAPVSKKHELKPDEIELNFLFATDVLSEGQNLQDAAILINYDLHWNPVRMIQRNGRVNRIGSKFNNVLIGNMKPAKDLEMYLKLVNRLETKINTIKNTIGLDQGILADADVNPIEFIEKYYYNGELPEEADNDLLAHTDEHILELRKFLYLNKDNQNEIERVRSIPVGKWNYLPEVLNKNNYALSLIQTQGFTSSGSRIDELYFIESDTRVNMVNHINYSTALDYIKTDEEDNQRYTDEISIDRNIISSRSMVEAVRQAVNPKDKFELKPAMIESLLILMDHFNDQIDLQGLIESGVHNTTDKKEIESIFRDTKKETKDLGSPNASTIQRFIKFVNKIQHTQSETRKIEETKGVLFYATKQ